MKKFTICIITIIMVLSLLLTLGVFAAYGAEYPKFPEKSQTHFIVYKEGYRDSRTEVCFFDIKNNDPKQYVVWDKKVELSNNEKYTNSSKYYLNNGLWTYFESDYPRISDYATEILMCDLDVYDGQGKLLIIGNEIFQETQDMGVVYLETLSPINSQRYTGNEGDSFIDKIGRRNGNIDIQGKSYTHGLTAWLARWNYKDETSWVWNEYNLSGQYDSLKGKIVIIESYNEDNFDTNVKITGDGKVLYDKDLTPANLPTNELNLNVDKVKKLTIAFHDNRSVSGGTAFGLADFRLVKSISDIAAPDNGAMADGIIKVMLNNKRIVFDQPPVLENGRTLVPLRAIFEAMGAFVEWDEATKTLMSQRNGKTISLTLGNTKAMIGNKPYYLDVPAKAIQGRTLVPVRFIAESFDCHVSWDGAKQVIEIFDNEDDYLTSLVKS